MSRRPAPVAVVLAVVVGALALLAPTAWAQAVPAGLPPFVDVLVPMEDPGTAYAPLTPARVLDTRAGATTVDGMHAGGGALGPATTRLLPLLGRGGLPASGIGAVVLNVTAVDPTAVSYLTVFPGGSARPTASNLNVVPGQVVPNLVVVPLGADGRISIFNADGRVHVIADVAGWFPADGELRGLQPARLLDTRPGTATVDGLAAGGGAVGPGGTRSLQVTGRGGVPSTGVGSVVLNVTATQPTAASWVTVHPTGEVRPLASNLNVQPGQTVPNLVVAKVGAGGKVDLYNAAGSTHLIVDVAAWLPPDGTHHAMSPARLVDTRAGATTADRQLAGGGRIAGGTTLTVPVAGRLEIPEDATAAVLNVTATEPTAATWLTVHPAQGQRPLASNLNAAPGQTVANLVLAKLGSDGAVRIYNQSGGTHVVVDVLGWMAPADLAEPPTTTTSAPATTTTTAPTTTTTAPAAPPAEATVPIEGYLTDLVLSPDGQEAYVVDAEHDVVHVVELAERKVVASIPVGDGVVGADVHPDGDLLLLASQGIARDLVVVDLVERRLVRRVPTPADPRSGYEPLDLAFGADGRAVVALGDDRSMSSTPGHVYLFDPDGDVFVDRPDAVPPSGVHDDAQVTASPDRSRITVFPKFYASSTYDVASDTWHVRQVNGYSRGTVGSNADGTLWVTERSVLDDELLVKGAIQSYAYAAAVDGAGTTAYALRDEGIDVVELEHFTRTGLLPLPDPAEGGAMALTSAGDELLVTTRSGLSIVPTATPGPPRPLPPGSEQATVTIAGRVRQITMAPDGLHVYATNTEANSVEVISVLTRTVVASIPVGAGPTGLDVSADGRTLYVANGESSGVSVVDLVARREVARLELGRPHEAHLEPMQVAVTTTTAYVTTTDRRFVGIDLASGVVTDRVWEVDGQALQPGAIRATPDHRKLLFRALGPAVWVRDEAAGTLVPREVSGGDGSLTSDADADLIFTGDVLLGPAGDQLGTIRGQGSAVLGASGSRLYRADAHRITVSETAHFTDVGTIALPDVAAGIGGPAGIVLTPDGLTAVVVTSDGVSFAGTVPTPPTEEAPPYPSEATVPILSDLGELVLSPDGALAYVAGGETNSVEVISVGRRERVGSILVGSNPGGLDLDATGRWLYVANRGGDNISVVDTLLRREVRRISTDRPGEDHPTDLGLLADGRAIVSTSGFAQPSKVLAVHLATGSLAEVTDGPLAEATCRCRVEASDDGRRVVLAGGSWGSPPARIFAYDLADDSWAHRDVEWSLYETAPTSPGGPLAVAPDGDHALLGRRVYSLPDLRQVGILGSAVSRTSQGFEARAGSGTTFSPDGRRIYQNDDQRIDVYELEHFAHLGEIPVEARTWAGDIAVTPDESTLVAVTTGGVSIVATSDRIEPATDHPWPGVHVPTRGYVSDVAVDADGRYAYASVLLENVVEVVDVVARARVARIPVGSRPLSVALSPDGATLYVANGAGADVSVVDVASRRELRRIPLPVGSGDVLPASIAIAADGVAFVVVGEGTTLVRIDLATEVATIDTRPPGTRQLSGLPASAGSSGDGSRVTVFGAGLRSTYDAATHAWTHVDQQGIDVPAHDATGDRLVIDRFVYDRAGTLVRELPVDAERMTLLDPTGALVYVLHVDRVQVFSVATGTLVRTLSIDARMSDRSAEYGTAVITPDGSTLLTEVSGGLHVVDLTTGS